MEKLNNKFDAVDSRLDGLEVKKQQLDHTIAQKQPKSALGRLNQLKARAGAREIEQKLGETKLEVQQGKQDLKARVQQEGAGAMQGIMPALMSSGKKP